MYKFKNSAGAVLGVLLMITACTVALPFAGYNLTGPNVAAAPSPSTQNVKVVNTSQEAVPVSGNVGINGTPNVKLDGSGNTVKIDPATPVLVRDVDNPMRQPFQATVYGNFQDQSVYSSPMDFAPVPVGKNLMIEYISARGMMLAGQKMIRLELWTTCNGSSNLYFFPLSYQGSDGIFGIYVASERVHLCASSTTAMYGLAVRDIPAGANNTSAVLTVSGYYVDAQ